MANGLIDKSKTMQQDKEFFIEFLTTFINRPGIDKLVNWLTTDSKSDFFTAPASTKYNLPITGGLVKHAINRLNILCYKLSNKSSKDILIEFKERQAKDKDNVNLVAEYSNEIFGTPDFALDSIAILGLLSDVAKANCYVLDVKQTKNSETGRWEPVEYWKWSEKFVYSSRGAKSTYIIQQFIPLFMEEAQAIAFIGAGESTQFTSVLDTTYRDIYTQSMLAVYLHTAEIEAGYVVDNKFEVEV